MHLQIVVKLQLQILIKMAFWISLSLFIQKTVMKIIYVICLTAKMDFRVV